MAHGRGYATGYRAPPLRTWSPLGSGSAPRGSVKVSVVNRNAGVDLSKILGGKSGNKNIEGQEVTITMIRKLENTLQVLVSGHATVAFVSF